MPTLFIYFWKVKYYIKWRGVNSPSKYKCNHIVQDVPNENTRDKKIETDNEELQKQQAKNRPPAEGEKKGNSKKTHIVRAPLQTRNQVQVNNTTINRSATTKKRTQTRGTPRAGQKILIRYWLTQRIGFWSHSKKIHEFLDDLPKNHFQTRKIFFSYTSFTFVK